MEEKLLENQDEQKTAAKKPTINIAKPGAKGKGKWFQKIPTDILFSPGGAILIIAALVMEIIDLIPIPVLDSLTWELLFELIFMALLAYIAKISFKSMLIPLIVERVPVISDILPSWLLKLLF
jgi:hypothetical protein